MDKIDTWINERFGTPNTFNRQLLDNFIEFLEKELGFAWKTDNQKEFLRGVAWATKEGERMRKELGYVIKDPDQSLPQCPTQEIVFGANIDYDRRKTKPYLQAQQDMLSEHWVKVKEKSNA